VFATPFIGRWKDKLSELGSPVKKTDETDISNSLDTAIKDDADTLRLCVLRTVEQHRQLCEAMRPILALSPDASSEAVRQKTRAFLGMDEVVRLREGLMGTMEALSVGCPYILVILFRAHLIGRARRERSLVCEPPSYSGPVDCFLYRSHVIQGLCVSVRRPLEVPILEYVTPWGPGIISNESSVMYDRPGATVDCLIQRLMGAGALARPQIFIRKQGKHTLTKSGRCWKWARGMELLQDLGTIDENGVPVVDYVDTETLQFAIAVVDDGRTECGHVLGTLLLASTTRHPE